MTFTQRKAQKLCEQWQELLGLGHWGIKVQIVRGSVMGHDNQGLIHPNDQGMKAQIYLLDPVDYDDDLFPQDQEVTIVHELLHILIGSITDTEYGTPARKAEENVVEILSTLLVTMKRLGAPKNQLHKAILKAVQAARRPI